MLSKAELENTSNRAPEVYYTQNNIKLIINSSLTFFPYAFQAWFDIINLRKVQNYAHITLSKRMRCCYAI